MRPFSIRTRVTAIACACALAIAGAAVATLRATSHEVQAMRHIDESSATLADRIMPLTERITTIRYDVAQVQQWLQDISATRGLDGLDDGPAKAAEYADDLAKQIAAAAGIAADLELPEVVSALEETKTSFQPFYATGRRMAQAYVDGGPAGGNPMMSSFDADAERMSDTMTRLIEIADAAKRESVAAMKDALAEIESSQAALQLTLMVCGGAILVALAGFVGFLLRSVTRPIESLTRVMRDLADGQHDVVVGFERRGDEIGSMAEAVRVFQRAARENAELRAEQERAQRQAEEERRQALAAMADRVESETRAAVDRVGEQTGGMAMRATTMLGTAEEVANISHDLASAADQALASATAMAAATEQLSASIAEIGTQVGAAAHVTREAVTKSDSARASIEALSQAVERIGAVAQMIDGFAQETNLLALNATIEAARAGEAGRGFAVVANEVKNLANGTASSTSEIASLLAQVKTATADAVNTVVGVAETIAQVSTISTAIAAAVEQQTATTRELARAGAETSAAAEHVSAGASRAASLAESSQAGARGVREEADDMSESVDKLRGALVRVVRTATADVDRRTHARLPVGLPCTLLASGASHRAMITDLSEAGARLRQAPALIAGTSGSLHIDGWERPLPFIVRDHEHDRIHVEFKLSGADAAAFAQELPSLTGTRAPLATAA